MKQILFYTDTPNIGGAEKQMLLLAKHLKQKGYSVSLAYGKYSRLKEIHEEFANHCDSIFVLNTLHKHDPRHYWELREILLPPITALAGSRFGGRRGQNDSRGFDLVHLHLWNPGACRYAFFAANRMRVPIITTEHDPFELKGLKRRVKLACLRRTAHTVAISRENKRDLQAWYNIPDNRISLVNNGIELPPVILRSPSPCHSEEPKATKNLPFVSVTNNSVKREILRCAQNDNTPQNDERGTQNDIVITCVAELHERKGHRYLIEAFERLQKTIPALRLVLVGRGPLEKELKANYGSNPRIHFLGWRDDVPEILRASDLFVLPSLKEAFGLSVLEAMASGVAVVATDSGGIKDIIENGKSGLLVPPGNTHKLAEAMAALLQNPEQKRAFEEAALKRVQNFSAERMAENTLRVYEWLTNGLRIANE